MDVLEREAAKLLLQVGWGRADAPALVAQPALSRLLCWHVLPLLLCVKKACQAVQSCLLTPAAQPSSAPSD